MRLIWIVFVVTLAGGCRQLFGIDDTVVAGDAKDPSDAFDLDAMQVTDVAHVRDEDEAALEGRVDLEFDADTIIDTNLLTISPAPSDPTLVFRVVRQDDGQGIDLALLDVRSLSVKRTVVIRGARPLVIVAREIAVEVGGILDASAQGPNPGGGGGAAAMGPGAGGDGAVMSSYDGGAGGAGFGSDGGPGGRVSGMLGGAGGMVYGDAALTILAGGSGGGSAMRCPTMAPGGGGGGALQLTARATLVIDGHVTVGGGGGAGGALCSSGTGGSGGGAGGGLYLQAAAVIGTGILTAGGGGGGGAANLGLNLPGEPGADAGLDGAAALGGAPAEPNGARGGDGAIADGTAGSAGLDAPSPSMNGGGGGGGVGRIAIRASVTTDTVRSYPSAARVPP